MDGQRNWSVQSMQVTGLERFTSGRPKLDRLNIYEECLFATSELGDVFKTKKVNDFNSRT